MEVRGRYPRMAESFRYDETTRVLEVRYRPDLAITAATEIVAPVRVYPDGVTVDCDGCQVEVAPGRVTLTSPPSGEAALVTLRPL